MSCHGHNNKNNHDFILDKLKASGSRVTEQRKRIVKYITKFKSPFCAEELWEKSQKDQIDLATIYRALNTFKELSVLESVDFGDGINRYEIKSEKHHHHVVCTECKKVESIHICSMTAQEELIEKMGFKNISHKLEFFGLCGNCSPA